MTLVIDGGGGGFDQHAAFTFLHGEPTVYAFSRDDVENALRNTYQADESGVVYAVTFVRPELLLPAAFEDVAGAWAAIWNVNAKVPGVTDIAPDQQVLPLGALQDVVDVAIESTSGRLTDTVTVSGADEQPDNFKRKIGAAVARLNAIEGVPS